MRNRREQHDAHGEAEQGRVLQSDSHGGAPGTNAAIHEQEDASCAHHLDRFLARVQRVRRIAWFIARKRSTVVRGRDDGLVGEKRSAPDVFGSAASHGRVVNTIGVCRHSGASRGENTTMIRNVWKEVVSGRLGLCLPGSRGARPRVAGRRRRRFISGLESLENRTVPSTFTVNTTLDAVVADRRTSLREAITKANAHPGTDTIVLRSGNFRLALTGADDTNVAGDLDITDSVVINGAGPGATVIDAQRLDRVFDVRGTAPHSIKVTFQGLTIRNGMSDSQGGGGVRAANADVVFQRVNVSGNSTSGKGGGIASVSSAGAANLTLINSVVSVNSASMSGGGIFGDAVVLKNSAVNSNSGDDGGGIEANTAVLTNSSVNGNVAGEFGGGIHASTVALTKSTVNGNRANDSGGGLAVGDAKLIKRAVNGNSAFDAAGGIFASSVTLIKSTVDGNSGGGDAGGILATAATLTGSTVSGNHAGRNGGGILATTVTLAGSTINGNTAIVTGGGISADSMASLTSSIVSGNIARASGGIAAGTVTLTNSTVSGNTASGGSGGGIGAGVSTLIGSTVSGNIASTDGGGISGDIQTLTNSTVSGNTAMGSGGGLSVGDLTLLNVTITGNRALSGGGVSLVNAAISSIRNTIVAGNRVDSTGLGTDLSGSFTSGGHNLIGDGTASRRLHEWSQRRSSWDDCKPN